MGKEGIIIIQHGDFPFDFMDKHREMFDFVKGMINRVSQKTREIERTYDDPYLVDMGKIMRCFKRIGGYENLELGFMEFVTPTIEDAVEKLERQGIKKIVFVAAPGIMMRSSHSLIDIPRMLRDIKTEHPNLKLVYTPPGVDFDKMADVFIKRIGYALGQRVESKAIPAGTFSDEWGVVLVGHGDVPLGYRQSNKQMEMTDKQIDTWSNMVRDWPRNEENDPLYCDTLKLEQHLKRKAGYDIAVGNLEFSSPTLQGALNQLKERGAKKVYFIGGTGFMDRSSHTLIDIPEVVAKLKENNLDVVTEYIYPNIEQVCDDLGLMLVEKVNQAVERGIAL
ncbi:MAG: sirohydrochlorin chelatase [Halobacteriota archaeon]